MRRSVSMALGLAGLLAAPVAIELRIKRPIQPLTNAWQQTPVEPRGSTRLGISYRSPQVDAFGLDPRATLPALLEYPFELVRLGAYWNRVVPRPGVFDTRELDWQVEITGRAGKQVILCVGALKTFGYPEFFAPRHVVASLPEGKRIRPADYAGLLNACTEFIARIVERYRQYTHVVAWQVEHESVDPLGMEHSWRLDTSFVESEVQTVRSADPTRPVLMNGYLPVSLPVRLMQWFQTRDQGDSVTAAQQLADIVGIDFYPCHALLGLGRRSVYLDGRRSPWQMQRLDQVLGWARRHGRRVMISEGQAEPWEAVTVPPNPGVGTPFSCPPERLIDNYNACVRRAQLWQFVLDAYLFWGAEYWMMRQRAGDPSYLQAFGRIVDQVR